MGGPGAPSFSEQAGQLVQASTNYSYPSFSQINSGAALGGIALVENGLFGGAFEISVDFTSLEPWNSFQDHAVVFSYIDEDNFSYVEALGFDPGGRAPGVGKVSVPPVFPTVPPVFPIVGRTVGGNLIAAEPYTARRWSSVSGNFATNLMRRAA